MAVEVPTLQQQIATALERKGLQLRPDPRDAKVTRLETTPLSRACWAPRNTGDVDAVTAWFADLDVKEPRQLIAALQKVTTGVTPTS